MVRPSNLFKNSVSKYFSPFSFITKYLVKNPVIKGITTNKVTDSIKVLHGTSTFDTPSKNLTIGTKAI